MPSDGERKVQMGGTRVPPKEGVAGKSPNPRVWECDHAAPEGAEERGPGLQEQQHSRELIHKPPNLSAPEIPTLQQHKPLPHKIIAANML